MSDSFSIISPAGYTLDVGFQAPANGIGTYGPAVVSQPLSGLGFQTLGTGEFALTPQQITGRQGTIEVRCVTGAQGTIQAVVLLSANSPPTNKSVIGIVLDAFNRPFAVIMDSVGTVIAQSLPPSPPVPAGTPLTLRLAWNAASPVRGGDFAVFEINNTTITAWGVDPTSAWAPFAPQHVFIGQGDPTLAYVTFGGAILKAQIGASPVYTVHSGTLILSGSQALLVGTTTVAAAIKAHLALSTNMAGAATVSPTLTVV